MHSPMHGKSTVTYDALTSTVTSTIHWTIYIHFACNKAENFSRNILLLTSATVK